MTFADVGANTGYWTKLLLPYVLPGGRAYATDVVSNINALTRGMPPEVTVRNLLTDNRGLPPDGRIDGIMMRMSFHYERYPAFAAAAYYKALRPGGLLFIAEHPGCDDPWGDKLTPDDIAKRVPVAANTFPGNPLSKAPHELRFRPLRLVFEAAGFVVRDKGAWVYWGPCNYFVVFEKPTQAEALAAMRVARDERDRRPQDSEQESS